VVSFLLALLGNQHDSMSYLLRLERVQMRQQLSRGARKPEFGVNL